MKHYRDKNNKKRRHAKWIKARRIAFTNATTDNYIQCGKCGYASQSSRNGAYEAHDIMPYHYIAHDIDNWTIDQLVANMVILCRYCHILCPQDEEDCRIWLSIKVSPHQPMTSRVMADLNIPTDVMAYVQSWDRDKHPEKYI